MRIRLFVLFVLMMTAGVVSAQDVKNVRAYHQDTVVYVMYDLKNISDISLQVSLDDDNEKYITVRELSGDVGNDIKPGKDKRIMWDYRNDIGELVNSNVSFKIIADRTDISKIDGGRKGKKKHDKK